MKHSAHTKTRKKAILVVLPLAYQDGRDRYVGLLQYIAKHRAEWNVHLVRENIQRRTLERELKGGIDGIIANTDMIGNSLIPLIPPDMPCVATDAIHPECFETALRNVAFVDADSNEIGRLGANYLAGQGNYTTFGFIGLDEPFHWSQTRSQSFRQTLAEKGVECSELNVRRSAMHEDDTLRAMCEWAAGLHRPAAVMAAMAVNQLLEHHWIIIDGFGMANHDERPFPASAPVHVPPCTMQRNAADRRRQYRHKVLHLHKMDNPVHHGLTPRRPATSARFRALSADGANLAFDALSPLVTTCSTLHPGHSRNA